MPLASKIFPRLWIVVLFGLLLLFSACEQREESDAVKSKISKENRILISGSSSVMPLLKTLAREFKKENGDVEITFLPDARSAAGIAGVAEGQYDIGAVSREMFAAEKSDGLQYIHLAIDGMVMATNVGIKIANLNRAVIRDIYAGKVTNWAQIGGPDGKITVVDRPEYSSAKIAFRTTFLDPDFTVTTDSVLLERHWQVADSIQMIPFSIGYTSLGELIRENPLLNVSAVNMVAPTPANLKSGRYAFFRPFGLVLETKPKAVIMRFLNFIYSEAGATIISKSGYLPQRYEILVGVVPERNVIVQEQRYQPLISYLSQRLGKGFSVKLKLSPSYLDVCKELVNGELDAAFVGSLAFAAVRKHVNVLVRSEQNGESSYRDLIFIRQDSGVEKLIQMRGKRLVVGGEATTAAYLFPRYLLTHEGFGDPADYFSETGIVGTYEDAIMAVFNGDVEVGSVKDRVLDMVARENPGVKDSLKIMAQSPPLPSNVFVLRKNLKNSCFECHHRLGRDRAKEGPGCFRAGLGGILKNYLLSMHDNPAGRAALAAMLNVDHFIETTPADYDELDKMLADINFNPEDLLLID
ncbi:MAG: PhnD/SsuA/transferrin family substrate-binding protein [Deltaproteobacteria bacterium]|nr:PhnD/SsuA/transferrin family substrate-binding protein [Candidatus Tharpella aukensis]